MTDGPARLRNWPPADGAWSAAQLSDPDIRRLATEQPATTAADFRSALEGLAGHSHPSPQSLPQPSPACPGRWL